MAWLVLGCSERASEGPFGPSGVWAFVRVVILLTPEPLWASLCPPWHRRQLSLGSIEKLTLVGRRCHCGHRGAPGASASNSADGCITPSPCGRHPLGACFLASWPAGMFAGHIRVICTGQCQYAHPCPCKHRAACRQGPEVPVLINIILFNLYPCG